MKCEKCGIEFEGEFCSQCGTPAEKTKKQKKPVVKKWWFWFLMGLATVVTLAAISGGESDIETSQGQQQGQNNNSSIVSTVSKDDDNIYNVGDTINANGLKITYISAENYTEGNKYMQPKDGYKYIRIKISAENTSSTDSYISSFDFSCYCDGKKVDSYYGGETEFEGGSLSKGRKTDGYIYFEVLKNAKDIEIEYETNFWSDKKAILKVDL